jgi:hypothetical protein
MLGGSVRGEDGGVDGYEGQVETAGGMQPREARCHERLADEMALLNSVKVDIQGQ